MISCAAPVGAVFRLMPESGRCRWLHSSDGVLVFQCLQPPGLGHAEASRRVCVTTSPTIIDGRRISDWVVSEATGSAGEARQFAHAREDVIAVCRSWIAPAMRSAPYCRMLAP